MSPSKRKRVLLLGQPNVGKSSLLKALTGSSVQISNYPGTTVEVTIARGSIAGVEYEFIDTPGIYNLFTSSIEEEVTEKALIEEDYDFAIVVIDATAIERGLVFLVSIIELGVPVIVALNFWEEADRKGLRIDYESLEGELGIPFVRINPIKKNGISELIKRMPEARKAKMKITYDDHIEKAISLAMKCIEGKVKLSRRGLAVRLVEGDPLITRLYECEHSHIARETLAGEGHDPYNDIEITRAGYAMSLTKMYVRIIPSSIRTISKFDEVLLKNMSLGILTGLSFLGAMIVLTVIFGNEIVNVLDSLLGNYVQSIVTSLAAHGLAGLALAKSIEALYAQYTAALPYVFIFYLILVIIEDTGFLTRLMLWLHMVTKKLGLHSKGVIPALLGLGCSVPATTATRILPTTRQRIVVISMLAFIPCSSRATIVFGIAGRINGAVAALGIYALGFILAAIVARIVSKAIKADEDAVLIEDVPPLRKPKTSIVAEKAWQRLREFIVIVTPLIVAGAVAYAFLTYYKIDSIVINMFAPLMSILHLPPSLSIPLAYGFLQKDLVISMTATIMGTSNFSTVLTAKQAMTFTMASTYQVPCIIALGMMIRELGLKRAILLWIIVDIIGFSVAALYANIPFP
ncbi:MAG: ferrous iron transport protein B [Desulfurococcales archaeon]|nr:ferrous iron transport protein B [Desulfurococcales archaeon]